MQPEPRRSSPAPVTPPTSRRDVRRAGASSAGRPGGAVGRRFARSALLAALAGATIAVPVLEVSGPPALADGGEVAPVVAVLGGPSARDVLASTPLVVTPTTLLAGGPAVRDVASAVSRSVDRDPLPGCDGQARPASANGQIPESDRCTLWDPAHSLRGDAAVAIAELNLAYRAAFGRNLCLTDSYRPLSVQRRLAVQKPRLAAPPGRSNHGWGLAVDLCSTETNDSRVMGWLLENGPTYGWDNPQWARRGGSGPYEPWHWEYAPGTTALGSNWDER